MPLLRKGKRLNSIWSPFVLFRTPSRDPPLASGDAELARRLLLVAHGSSQLLPHSLLRQPSLVWEDWERKLHRRNSPLEDLDSLALQVVYIFAAATCDGSLIDCQRWLSPRCRPQSTGQATSLGQYTAHSACCVRLRLSAAESIVNSITVPNSKQSLLYIELFFSFLSEN